MNSVSPVETFDPNTLQPTLFRLGWVWIRVRQSHCVMALGYGTFTHSSSDIDCINTFMLSKQNLIRAKPLSVFSVLLKPHISNNVRFCKARLPLFPSFNPCSFFPFPLRPFLRRPEWTQAFSHLNRIKERNHSSKTPITPHLLLSLEELVLAKV